MSNVYNVYLERVKELSMSVSVNVDTYPMLSTTVGRIGFAYYNGRSLGYPSRKSVAGKHSHELSTAPSS